MEERKWVELDLEGTEWVELDFGERKLVELDFGERKWVELDFEERKWVGSCPWDSIKDPKSLDLGHGIRFWVKSKQPLSAGGASVEGIRNLSGWQQQQHLQLSLSSVPALMISS